MAVGALDVCVLKKGGGGQNVVGVVGGVSEEKFVDHCEEVWPQQPAPHGILVGSHRGRVRVIDKERMNRRT